MTFSLVWLLLLILKVTENQQLSEVRLSFPNRLENSPNTKAMPVINQTEFNQGYCWKVLEVVMFYFFYGKGLHRTSTVGKARFFFFLYS